MTDPLPAAIWIKFRYGGGGGNAVAKGNTQVMDGIGFEALARADTVFQDTAHPVLEAGFPVFAAFRGLIHRNSPEEGTRILPHSLCASKWQPGRALYRVLPAPPNNIRVSGGDWEKL